MLYDSKFRKNIVFRSLASGLVAFTPLSALLTSRVFLPDSSLGFSWKFDASSTFQTLLTTSALFMFWARWMASKKCIMRSLQRAGTNKGGGLRSNPAALCVAKFRPSKSLLLTLLSLISHSLCHHCLQLRASHEF